MLKLARSPQSFDELKTLTRLESRSIKEHITYELQQQRNDLAHKHHCQEFLKSLWFPEIHRRQETVSEAYQRTFQWVYKPDAVGRSAHHWDSIVQWFERGDGIYWISGKAGSGKSTLMNYICQDSRSQDLLKVWSGTKDVLTLTFFFWKAGTSLEKSTEGLLRSVLYQILNRFPALIPSAYDERSDLSSGQSAFGQTLAWTERRLLKAFHNLVPQVQKKCRICIFIDGLDEIGGESDAAIEMVKRMISADLKVCLSSRPDLAYADAFDSCPMLRLQDLTELDIKTYLRDRLQPHLQINTQEDVAGLIDRIALRAQGVFLWVDLVVKAMIKGLRNHDSLNQLRTRIDSTPSDIEALYAQMLSNVEVAYREEAAQLFHMALEGFSNSLLNVALTMNKGFERASDMSIQEALHLSCRTRHRIPAVCAGLLEVYVEDVNSKDAGNGKVSESDALLTLPYRRANTPEKADTSFYERYAHVIFIHRTAMDFFGQSKQGRLFLTEYTVSSFNVHSTYVRGLLAKVTLLGFPTKPPSVSPSSYANYFFLRSRVHDQPDDSVDKVAGAFVLQVMKTISVGEMETATALRSLCDDVDRTLTDLYKKDPVVSPLSHWSTRWTRVDEKPDISVRGSRWSKRTSRSSSAGSFGSTRNEPTLYWNIPFDFLGVAACWGLYFYVVEMLALQQKHLDQEYASYLMSCSVCSFDSVGSPYTLGLGVYVPPSSSRLDILTELLSAGGNPNMYVGDLPTTIWGLFLSGIEHVVYASHSTAFIKTMEAFLKSDANVHIMTPGFINVPDSPRGPAMAIGHEMSVLYVVRSWMVYMPRLRSVEEMVLAKGGKDSHVLTHVALPSEGYKIRHEISQKRHDKLIAALDEVGHDHPTYWNPIVALTESGRWAEQLGKTYIEISDTYPDPDDSASSDEEEFFDSLDTLNVDDV